MAETYKILGQALTGEIALDGTTVKETIVYEVPNGTQASVSAIEITNSDIASQTYKVSFVKNADVAAATGSVNYTIGGITDRYVALATGNSNKAAYSTDGITWTATTMPSVGFWESAAYGNGKFVAVGYQGQSAYSTDGITWTESGMPNETWKSVVFGNGKFVAVPISSNNAVYSTDGITWASSTLPTSGYWFSVAYGNGKFVAIEYNSNNAAYSTNGITWIASTLPSSSLFELTFGNGKFVAVGYQGQSAYSTDGITWTASTMPSVGYWASVTYGNGKFVAIEYYSNNAAYSTDGVTWIARPIPSSTLYSVTYGNGKFVAVPIDNSNNAAYSTDGITWTAATMPSSAIWASVNYGQINTQQTLQDPIPQSLNKHVAVYNKSIASGETHEIKGGVTLSAGDQVRVYSTSNEIITNIYGVELS